jgi:hypothetical protein
MIKHIALLTKKQELSYDEFVQRYEKGHVPLINEIYPFFEAYRRNYIIPGGIVSLDHIKNSRALPSFDAITEFWFKDQSAVESLSRRSSETDAGERVTRDEQQFLEPARTVIVQCEEKITPAHLLRSMPAGSDGKPEIKYIALAKAKAGTIRDELISHYENHHSRLGVELLDKDGKSIFARYSRSYPITQNALNFEQLGYDSQGVDFDVMSQFSFWNEEDFETFRSMCADREISSILSADEERFLDRESIQTFLVEEHESILKGEQPASA